MSLFKRLRFGERRRNGSIKKPEAFTGVAVGCRGGSGSIIEPTPLTSSVVRDSPSPELTMSTAESASMSESLIETQTPKPLKSLLAPVTEEAALRLPQSQSHMSNSPLLTGPSLYKTVQKESPIPSPRRYSNEALANRTPVIRGQKIAERTALFENSPVKYTSTMNVSASTTNFDKATESLCTTEELDPVCSGSPGKNTSSVERGSVDRKKKWLEQAFTPTGGGNMLLSEDEDESKASRFGDQEDPLYDVTPTPSISGCSIDQQLDASPALSTREVAGPPSPIFRLQSENTLTERPTLSALVCCEPMNVTSAYRVWHAKGMLAFQPDKPMLSSSTADRSFVSHQIDNNNSTPHLPGNVRTSNGKVIMPVSLHVEESCKNGRRLPFVVFDPFDTLVDAQDREKVSRMDPNALWSYWTKTRSLTMVCSRTAPILSWFGGKTFLFKSPAASVKRDPSSRQTLFNPASLQSAIKSRNTSLERSRIVLQHCEVMLTLFGGRMLTKAIDVCCSATQTRSAFPSPEFVVKGAPGDGDCISIVRTSCTVPNEQHKTLEVTLAALSPLDNLRSVTPDSSHVETDVNVKSCSSQSVANQPSNKVEAYQKYVQAYKTYKNDRTSIENLALTENALQWTKSTALARPPSRQSHLRMPIILSLFTGASMDTPLKAGQSNRVQVYHNHVQALKRRTAKKRHGIAHNE
ncbi:hypothetical protein MPSEU_000097800 [Mayamaea pseudoterrestris]|nr:hypothetical protein MPSEU_000097100 [Mayamaea pseudoterrestris]GKY91252.1 hypothetical protein MPSEU_000097800 [Mayamaea pseudoterrestris]